MSEYVEYLKEIFEQFGPITVRKMFGGYGIYFSGLMFALVADDTLYLKTDEESSVFFKKKGLGQFEYNKKGRTVKLSYYLAPEEIMEDRDQAAVWARRAFESALRAQGTKSKAKKKRKDSKKVQA